MASAEDIETEGNKQTNKNKFKKALVHEQIGGALETIITELNYIFITFFLIVRKKIEMHRL